MIKTDNKLSTLLYKACSFDEKKIFYHKSENISYNETEAIPLIEKWIKIGFRGNENYFQKKLIYEDIDHLTLRKIISAKNVLIEESEIPGWFSIFIEFSHFLEENKLNQDIIRNSKSKTNRMPFYEIILPFAEFSFSLLKEKLGDAFKALNNDAEENLKWDFITLYFNLLNQVLLTEFNLFKIRKFGPIGKLVANQINFVSDQTYKDFVTHFLNVRVNEFFDEYPLLIKLYGIITLNAINHYTNVLTRFQSDLSEINLIIGCNSECGKIKSLQSNLSDNHNGGQSVCIIHFESGFKIVYKPKDLEIDKSFFALLSKINSYNVLPDFLIPKMIVRPDYGWVEFIENRPCRSKEDIKRFYTRMGSFIFLIYLFNGNDYHLENLIAHGEHPVLIDLETLMHHPSIGKRNNQERTAMDIVAEDLGESVFKTGFLPRWDLIGNNKAVDVSALGSYGKQEAPYQRVEWLGTNTDKMKVEKVNYNLEDSGNLPILDGIVQLPNIYLEDIVFGFKTLYNFIQANQSKLSFDDFINKKIRYVFRSTNDYGLLIRQLALPKNQVNGIYQNYFADLLSNYVLSIETEDVSTLWQIFVSEKSQLLQNDFPSFYSTTNSKSLIGADGSIINDAFAYSAYDKFLNRLQTLNEKDCAKQIEYIKGSLYFRELREVDHYHNLKTRYKETANSTISKSILIEEAIKIAEQIIEKKVVAKDGSISWMGVGYNNQLHVSQFQPMGIGLYDGLAGVSLFLSAIFSNTRDDKFLEPFYGTIKSLRHFLKTVKDNKANRNGLSIGVAAGISSVIYSLILSSDFLHDKSLVVFANDFFDLIDDDLILADKTYDVISGSAGGILGMLKLYQATNNPLVLERAAAMGNHLLSNRVSFQNKFNVWKTGEEEKMLTGFSHGQAGIIHSLIRLSEITNDERYIQAAHEALEYENSVFDEKENNWPDFRRELPDGKKSFMNAWCHGASGIGQSRLTLKKANNNLQLQRDVNAAVINSVNHDILVADHICCGNLSIINFLHEAGTQLKDPTLTDNALQRLSIMIARSKNTNGNYNLFHDPSERIFNPGFFQGISGIGYYLLRFSETASYPNVLIFE